jgi:hypothetical protein
MSATLRRPTPPAPTRRKGSLFRSELHRFRSRRFIQVLLGLAVLGWVAATGIALLTYGEPSQADYAVAQERLDQFLAAEEQWREQCAAGAMAAAAAAAAMAFLIGATWIGAEWSTRSIVALLFWVPARLTVVGMKIGVLLLATAFLGVIAQLGWLLTATILRSLVGADRELPADFWPDLLAQQGRSVLLTVLAGLLGFGLANLIRSTGAALGVGFVYFAIVENTLRIVEPTWDRWLLSTNAVALVLPGGTRIHDYSAVEAQIGAPPFYLVTNLQGGLIVTAFAAVIVGVGVLLFTRRDLH